MEQTGAAPPQLQQRAAAVPLQFTGNAGEYFRIWIVNLCLSVLTLGIYSAWAKVRRKRYFYGSTLLDGSAFEYLGNPVAILKGRVIVVVAFAAYALLKEVHDLIGGALFDRTGGYRVTLGLAMGVLAVACAASVLLQRLPRASGILT